MSRFSPLFAPVTSALLVLPTGLCPVFGGITHRDHVVISQGIKKLEKKTSALPPIDLFSAKNWQTDIISCISH